METFNTLIYEPNRKTFVPFDVIPQLVDAYHFRKEHNMVPYPCPVTRDEFKKFVEDESKYLWWGKCGYEIIVSGWPNTEVQDKISTFDQVMLNLDVVVEKVMKSIQTS